MEGGARPMLLGLFSGAMFALSAIGYRGAILSLGLPSFVMAATFTLTVGLVMQAALLTLYLALRDRAVLTRHHARLAAVAVRRLHGRDRVAVLVSGFRARPAPPTCARSRWSRCCSRRRSRASSSSSRRRTREALGMALIVLGVALLIWAQ